MAAQFDPKREVLAREVKAAYRTLARGSAEDACETPGEEGRNFIAYRDAFMRLDAYDRAASIIEPSPSRTIRELAPI